MTLRRKDLASIKELASNPEAVRLIWTAMRNMDPGAVFKMIEREKLFGYGTESFYASHRTKQSSRVTYVNTGDTYDTTLVRSFGKWRVTSWGDELEFLESKGYTTTPGSDHAD